MSVTVKYKGSAIATLTENGTKTLKTSGKYCEADIVVENTKDGGATITDGIVVKARDADGYATEVDFYGTVVEKYQFGQGSNNTVGFMRLKKVNYKNACTTIKEGAFANSGKNSESPAPIPETLTEIEARAFRSSQYISAELPISLTGRLPDNLFSENTVIKTIKAPGITSLDTLGGSGNGQFLRCTGLENCEIGSIGYGVTYCETWNFKDCTQSGLSITVFTNAANVDKLLANIRNGATKATIVLKAAEDTEYNGRVYAAGTDIISSSVAGEVTA